MPSPVLLISVTHGYRGLVIDTPSRGQEKHDMSHDGAPEPGPPAPDPLHALAVHARQRGSVSFRVDGELYVCLPASAFAALASTTFSPTLSEMETVALTPVPVALTERQRQLLRVLARGASALEAADQLGVSVNTVAAHLVAIRRKYGVRRTADAIDRAQAQGQL